jgi:hypothetical protein
MRIDADAPPRALPPFHSDMKIDAATEDDTTATPAGIPMKRLHRLTGTERSEPTAVQNGLFYHTPTRQIQLARLPNRDSLSQNANKN